MYSICGHKDVLWSTRCLVNNTTPQAFHRTSFFTFKSPWRAVASGLCMALQRSQEPWNCRFYWELCFQRIPILSFQSQEYADFTHATILSLYELYVYSWTSCHPSKLSTVPMVSRAWCTGSPTRERASITPCWKKTTGNLGKFTQILQDFIRARLAQAKDLALGRTLVLVAICICVHMRLSRCVDPGIRVTSLKVSIPGDQGEKKLRFR